jgi:hypothetical protein
MDSGYLSYAYSSDFVSCMKQRNAMISIQKHLAAASNVASLTYGAVFNATTTPKIAKTHTNATTSLSKITSFILILTDSSALNVDILLMLMEARCFRSFVDNPLLKCCKMWAADPNSSMVEQHRGYIPSSSGHRKTTHTTDVVHSVWCTVLKVFSSLIRSAKRQVVAYAKVDHMIKQQILPITNAVFDFVCSFEQTIFSCFSSMHAKPKETVLTEKKGFKSNSSTSASTISASSFCFTANLLQEACCISSLFEQICKSPSSKFEAACPRIYNKMIQTMLDMAKMLSSFLGSISNARELFTALSSASTLSFDQPSSMFDAHPLLADGESSSMI